MVMAVFNGESVLVETLESVLAQEGVDFEFVVVNDGSTDGTSSILDKYSANDGRLKVINQTNVGLTRSLIRGCAEASGEFIARQDAGDVSLQGRLRTEYDALNGNPGAALVSCGTRFVGPDGETIREVVLSEKEANFGLRGRNLAEMCGPSSHGSTMFRRAVYDKVGGYRWQFGVAQDLDLWTRLIEQGEHITVPEILCTARLTPDGISNTKRKLQLDAAAVILECIERRKCGRDDEDLLGKLHGLDIANRNGSLRIQSARFFYFLGSSVAAENQNKARAYFLKSLRNNPLHIKAAFRYLRSVI